MTMLSFRVEAAQARAADEWAERLGIDRSELLREALRRQLVRLASEHDAATWRRVPLSEEEKAISDAAHWGPAEDWADWADATR